MVQEALFGLVDDQELLGESPIIEELLAVVVRKGALERLEVRDGRSRIIKRGGGLELGQEVINKFGVRLELLVQGLMDGEVGFNLFFRRRPAQPILEDFLEDGHNVVFDPDLAAL